MFANTSRLPQMTQALKARVFLNSRPALDQTRWEHPRLCEILRSRMIRDMLQFHNGWIGTGKKECYRFHSLCLGPECHWASGPRSSHLALPLIWWSECNWMQLNAIHVGVMWRTSPEFVHRRQKAGLQRRDCRFMELQMLPTSVNAPILGLSSNQRQLNELSYMSDLNPAEGFQYPPAACFTELWHYNILDACRSTCISAASCPGIQVSSVTHH